MSPSWLAQIIGKQGFSSTLVKEYDEEAYIFSLLGTTISETSHGHTTTHKVNDTDVQEALLEDLRFQRESLWR